MKILFITWDAPNAVYLNSLFLPIFDKLLPYGIEIHVLQCTWAENAKDKKKLAEETSQIKVYRVSGSLSKVRILRPLLMLRASLYAIYLTKTFNYDFIMPRSIIPGAVALIIRSLLKTPMIYDCDGFASDEAVEYRDRSSTGLIHLLHRYIEYLCLVLARSILVRTAYAAEVGYARVGGEISLKKKFHVVSNGRPTTMFNIDLRLDKNNVRHDLGISIKARVMVYSGSIGPQYRLDKVLEIFGLCFDAGMVDMLLILTFDLESFEHYLKNLTRQVRSCIKVISVPHSKVASILAAMDVGIALREQSMSMLCVSPVKIPEYLLCGLPLITNSQIYAKFECQGILTLKSLDRWDLSSVSPWLSGIFAQDRAHLSREIYLFANVHFNSERAAREYQNAISFAYKGVN
jgi:hypothetical protein